MHKTQTYKKLYYWKLYRYTVYNNTCSMLVWDNYNYSVLLISSRSLLISSLFLKMQEIFTSFLLRHWQLIQWQVTIFPDARLTTTNCQNHFPYNWQFYLICMEFRKMNIIHYLCILHYKKQILHLCCNNCTAQSIMQH